MIRRFSGHVARVTAAAALLLLTACADWATTPNTTDDGARFNKRGAEPTLRTATWTGNGSSWDGEQFIITDSRCEESEGEPYLYWVLTAGGNASIDAATISIDGESAPMDRVSKGSFKYTQTFEGTFEVPENVSASYTNAKSANLVLSHGCVVEASGPTGLTIQFRPVETNQEVWYCRDALQSTVCQAYGPGRVLNWTTFNTAGGVLEEYNIPLATLNAENTTGFFNVSVLAPNTPPAGSKIGPGEGITCLQRSGPAVVGTVNGFLSNDWTSSNPRAYWYTGCSLNSGVTHAYFYAYHVATP